MVARQRRAAGRRFLLALCLCLGFGAAIRVPLAARARQDPARLPQTERPTFRSGTTLVQLEAVVRRRDGAFADDLTRDEFVVLEDGQPRPVETFYVISGGQARSVTPAPEGVPVLGSAVAGRRVFVLVFDLDHMRAGRLARARAAAFDFVEHSFLPGDVGGVISNGVLANHRLTSDAAELAAAIRAVRPTGESEGLQRDVQDWPQMNEAEAVAIAESESGAVNHPVRDAVLRAACSSSPDSCDPFTVELVEMKARGLAQSARVHAGQTLAMLAALARQLGRLPGRKSVLFFTDGFYADRAEAEIRAVVGEAARSSVAIYTLDTRGLDRGTASSDILTGATPVLDGTSSLLRQMMVDADQDGPMRLAAETGGLSIRNENDFSRALRAFADDSASYYVLGYRSTNTTADGRVHAVVVRITRPGLTARARKSYTALEPAVPTPLAAAPGSPQAREEFPVLPLAAAAPSPPAVPPGSVIPSTLVPSGAGPVIPPGSARGVGIHLRPAGHTGADDTARLRASSAAVAGAAWTADLAEQARAGWEAYGRGDTGAARDALSGPASNLAAPPWVHYVLGWAAFAEGAFPQARHEWQTVRTQVPEFQPVYFDLADAHLRDRQAREAAAVLRDAAKRWPAGADVLNALGVVLTSGGELDEAIALFEQVRKAAPDDLSATFNLAAASEIRYVASIRPTEAAEPDRTRAVEHYRAVLGRGGALADASREGLRRLVPLDVTRLAAEAPARIATFGRDRLNGTPVQLAWSADGRQLFVRAVVAGYGAEEDFVVSVEDGRITKAPGRPDWAAAYWRWKAAQQAPWLPTIRIKAETKRVTGFNMTDGGNSERAYAPVAGQSMSNALTLHGQVIGEASSGAVVAGRTFGWAPFAMGAVAFTDSRGRLILMDVEGRKQRVEGTAGVSLPAWSPDGRQVAFLGREGSSHVLFVVRLSNR